MDGGQQALGDVQGAELGPAAAAQIPCVCEAWQSLSTDPGLGSVGDLWVVCGVEAMREAQVQLRGSRFVQRP